MLRLVDAARADARLNRANAAAARRVERGDLRGLPHAPIPTVNGGPMFCLHAAFGLERKSPV